MYFHLPISVWWKSHGNWHWLYSAFGICGNLCNISVNTQAVHAEALYQRPIMASFHGIWSTAGFTGALIGSQMMKLDIKPYYHFWIIALFAVTMMLIFNKYLLLTPTSKLASSFRKIKWPHGSLLLLGVIAFCCMSAKDVCSTGAAFISNKVVKAEGLSYITWLLLPL
jgi:predicted branched-subunit amino acid permease